ncbi:MAG TPA: LPS export ABC transporter periplasmic protein LptC [Candidatus Cybelea sp.]|nr:LPS export ABC transporter periplasmic protein LptC [Candidatus Cybelea sp.]
METPVTGTAASGQSHYHAQWLGEGSHRALHLRSLKRNRFIAMMKLLLPLAALVLVGLVIAWPQLHPRYGSRIALSFSDVELQDQRLRMANPRYQGIDNHGRPYLVTADSGIQEGAQRETVVLDNVQADITLEDGTWAALTAKKGTYHDQTKILDLAGDVSVYSDRGYEFHGPTAHASLVTGEITSDDPVHGQGPYGLLNANGFWLADKGNHMRFLKGVKVTLYPQGAG